MMIVAIMLKLKASKSPSDIKIAKKGSFSYQDRLFLQKVLYRFLVD